MLFRSVIAFAFGCLILALQPAHAEEPIETAIREWVSAINGSPDWKAGYRRVSYDPTDGRAVLTGLSIESEPPGVTIAFETIMIYGFRQTADGGFAADRLLADNGAAEFGVFKVAFADVEVNEVAIPALPSFTWDPAKPFTSMIRAYAPLARMSMTNGRIGATSLIETNGETSSRITYNEFRIDRWHDGKIAAVTAGPITMDAPEHDGLLQMKVASFETRDIDIDATLNVLDPDRYVGGVGDGVWHPVSGLTAYRNLSIDGPGVEMTLNLMSVEGLRMRQPAASFADFFDRLILDPDYEPATVGEMQSVIDMLASYGVGRFGISGLDIAATGVEGFHLGGFSISDFSIDRLGEFAVNDFATAVADQGTVRVGRFAFGDMALPGAEALLKALRVDAAGETPDLNEVAPKLGFLEISGFDIETVDLPRTKLNSMRVDLANYIGVVPTTVVVAMNGLQVPVSAMDERARAVFDRLGIENANIDYRMNANWREADEALTVNDFQFDMKGAGGLGLSMILNGLPRSAIEDPESLEDVLPTLKLSKARVTLTDDSIVGKGLDMLAEKMKAPPEKFRQQFADAMPLLLSLFVLRDPQIAGMVRKSGLLAAMAPVVKAFVGSPGSSITVSLSPTKPLSLDEITGIATQAPEALIETLGFEASSTGTMPPETPKQAPPANQPPKDADGADKGMQGKPAPLTTPAPAAPGPKL